MWRPLRILGFAFALALQSTGCGAARGAPGWVGPAEPSYVAVGAPELRRGTVRDGDRTSAGLGVLRVCLRELGPTFGRPGADTVRARGRVRVRLWRPGGGGAVAGAEGGARPDECALVEAPAGRYQAQVQGELGPYGVELRRGQVDTLLVLYRVQLAPVAHSGPARAAPNVARQRPSVPGYLPAWRSSSSGTRPRLPRTPASTGA